MIPCMGRPSLLSSMSSCCNGDFRVGLDRGRLFELHKHEAIALLPCPFFPSNCSVYPISLRLEDESELVMNGNP